MNIFKIVGAIFSVLGIAALAGTIMVIINTNNFIAHSTATRGQITDIVTKTSTDSDGHTTRSRFPVIRFLDNSGRAIEFESSTSTGNQTQINDTVTVRYTPDNPRNARMADSFMDLWGLSIILGFFGIVFTGLGIPFFWLGIRDNLNQKKAQTYTKEITADVKGAVYNTSISANGRCPYQIEAQWLNPNTNEIHVFKSAYIWYDPSDFLKDKILVKADPMNLKKYWMDISWLPKKAK